MIMVYVWFFNFGYVAKWPFHEYISQAIICWLWKRENKNILDTKGVASFILRRIFFLGAIGVFTGTDLSTETKHTNQTNRLAHCIGSHWVVFMLCNGLTIMQTIKCTYLIGRFTLHVSVTRPGLYEMMMFSFYNQSNVRIWYVCLSRSFLTCIYCLCIDIWKWITENPLPIDYCKRSVSGKTSRGLKLVEISGGKCAFYTHWRREKKYTY